jgi:hypothetical protein
VKVFDKAGEFLGWGLKEDIDRTHIAFAVPFAWYRRRRRFAIRSTVS